MILTIYNVNKLFIHSFFHSLFCIYEKDFTYKNVELLDLPETKIQPHFKEMFHFIETGCDHGSVLVHW
jgi:hypothetical protein